MSNLEDFQPKNEAEKQWVEQYNQLSDFISEKIRGLNEKERIATLKELGQSDLALMNLYMRSLKKEDYETSAAAKKLLEESGYKTPS